MEGKKAHKEQVVGARMMVAICSTCRVLGLDKVHSAFKDHQTQSLDGNIRAFEKLMAFREGSTKLPMNRQIQNKELSQEAINTSMHESNWREEVYLSMMEEDIEEGGGTGAERGSHQSRSPHREG